MVYASIANLALWTDEPLVCSYGRRIRRREAGRRRMSSTKKVGSQLLWIPNSVWKNDRRGFHHLIPRWLRKDCVHSQSSTAGEIYRVCKRREDFLICCLQGQGSIFLQSEGIFQTPTKAQFWWDYSIPNMILWCVWFHRVSKKFDFQKSVFINPLNFQIM